MARQSACGEGKNANPASRAVVLKNNTMRVARQAVHDRGGGAPGTKVDAALLGLVQELRLQLTSQQGQLTELSRFATGEINRLWAAVAGKDISVMGGAVA